VISKVMFVVTILAAVCTISAFFGFALSPTYAQPKNIEKQDIVEIAAADCYFVTIMDRPAQLNNYFNL
jgi:hypothetical protein